MLISAALHRFWDCNKESLLFKVISCDMFEEVSLLLHAPAVIVDPLGLMDPNTACTPLSSTWFYKPFFLVHPINIGRFLLIAPVVLLTCLLNRMCICLFPSHLQIHGININSALVHLHKISMGKKNSNASKTSHLKTTVSTVFAPAVIQAHILSWSPATCPPTKPTVQHTV